MRFDWMCGGQAGRGNSPKAGSRPLAQHSGKIKPKQRCSTSRILVLGCWLYSYSPVWCENIVLRGPLRRSLLKLSLLMQRVCLEHFPKTSQQTENCSNLEPPRFTEQKAFLSSVLLGPAPPQVNTGKYIIQP